MNMRGDRILQLRCLGETWDGIARKENLTRERVKQIASDTMHDQADTPFGFYYIESRPKKYTYKRKLF